MSSDFDVMISLSNQVISLYLIEMNLDLTFFFFDEMVYLSSLLVNCRFIRSCMFQT